MSEEPDIAKLKTEEFEELRRKEFNEEHSEIVKAYLNHRASNKNKPKKLTPLQKRMQSGSI